MSTIWYKGLCQVEVKLKFRICYSPRAFKCKKVYGTNCYNCIGASYYNCIGASCYNCNNARAARTNELCADNDIYLTTTCECFISLVKPSVLVYNQYCKW